MAYYDIPVDRLRDIVYYYPIGKQYRVGGTAGGNLLDVPYDVSARTASLDMGNPLSETRYEYIRIERRKLPPASIAAHNLEPLFYNDAVYFQICKCMYGLPQAGHLSQL